MAVGYLDIGIEDFSIQTDHRDIPAEWLSVDARLPDALVDVHALAADGLPVPVEYRHIPFD